MVADSDVCGAGAGSCGCEYVFCADGDLGRGAGIECGVVYLEGKSQVYLVVVCCGVV